MKCPFCDTEMVLGRICGTSGHCAYWIPDGSGVEGALTVKRIEKAGGLVMGSATRIGFFTKERPETWHCPQCQLLVTKLLERNER